MVKALELSDSEFKLVVRNTADKLNMSMAIIEKDFWVCILLRYLFSELKYRDYIVFKGGTSLSKVYNLIERFSEDIDLALDWRLLGYREKEPYEDRSNSGQLKFNEKMNKNTASFLCDEFLPILRSDFKGIIKNREYDFYIDTIDNQTICFEYPKFFRDGSILQVIRLEVGCLAEPIPASRKKIRSYIKEVYPDIFDENIDVFVVDCLRTFYEKITILHREANRVNGNYPLRYSRHYYDVYKILNSDIKNMSFKNIDLLKSVIEFKKKFYASNWAKYDEIMEGKLKLVPPKEGLEIFLNDYKSMKNMLFGEKIINTLKEYEYELNRV